jgi:hypothetical protein
MELFHSFPGEHKENGVLSQFEEISRFARNDRSLN